ncbi:MAG TPA: haloacid dehalogenase type II [Gemmataceae bacterium]|nr:haloacid dehalogenase type II [Gemmataceae bacterium]
MTVDPVKVLAFDVFGTVVDVRGSLSRAVSEYGARRGLEADWAAAADRWASGHDAAVAEVRDGRRAWEPVDALNRSVLDRVLDVHGLGEGSEADREELNGAWHRLSPWPDAPEGLGRLHARFRLVTLSNGNETLLRDMAAAAGLPWDDVLSAESVRRYKPDPAVYHMAIDRLRLPPGEIMMVAAHKYDLEAAAGGRAENCVRAPPAPTRAGGAARPVCARRLVRRGRLGFHRAGGPTRHTHRMLGGGIGPVIRRESAPIDLARRNRHATKNRGIWAPARAA